MKKFESITLLTSDYKVVSVGNSETNKVVCNFFTFDNQDDDEAIDEIVKMSEDVSDFLNGDYIKKEDAFDLVMKAKQFIVENPTEIYGGYSEEYFKIKLQDFLNNLLNNKDPKIK